MVSRVCRAVRVTMVVPSGARELSEVEVTSFGAVGKEKSLEVNFLPIDIASTFTCDYVQLWSDGRDSFSTVL